MRKLLLLFALPLVSSLLLKPSNLAAQNQWNPNFIDECQVFFKSISVADSVFAGIVEQYLSPPSNGSETDIAGFCMVPYVQMQTVCPYRADSVDTSYSVLGYSIYLAYWDESSGDRLLALFGVNNMPDVYNLPMSQSGPNDTYFTALDDSISVQQNVTKRSGPDFSALDERALWDINEFQLVYLDFGDIKHMLSGTSFLEEDPTNNSSSGGSILDNLTAQQPGSGQIAPTISQFVAGAKGNRGIFFERSIAAVSQNAGPNNTPEISYFRTLIARPTVGAQLAEAGIRESAVTLTYMPHCPPDWFENENFFQNPDDLSTPFRTLEALIKQLEERNQLNIPEPILIDVLETEERLSFFSRWGIWILIAALLLGFFIGWLIFRNPPTGEPGFSGLPDPDGESSKK